MKRKTIFIIIGVIVALAAIVGGLIFFDIIDISKFFEKDNVALIEEYPLAIDGKIQTNIKNSRKYVSCEVVLVINDHAEFLKLEATSFKIKNLILEILRSLEEADYTDDKIQDRLSSMIITKVSEELVVSSIARVYFEQLVTQ